MNTDKNLINKMNYQKLIAQNEKLKMTNRILLIYVILSMLIMLYNSFF